MTMVKLPTLKDYWAKSNYYHIDLCSNLMTRKKFLLILSSIHYGSDTVAVNENNIAKQFEKINPLIKSLNNKFRQSL